MKWNDLIHHNLGLCLCAFHLYCMRPDTQLRPFTQGRCLVDHVQQLFTKHTYDETWLLAGLMNISINISALVMFFLIWFWISCVILPWLKSVSVRRDCRYVYREYWTAEVCTRSGQQDAYGVAQVFPCVSWIPCCFFEGKLIKNQRKVLWMGCSELYELSIVSDIFEGCILWLMGVSWRCALWLMGVLSDWWVCYVIDRWVMWLMGVLCDWWVCYVIDRCVMWLMDVLLWLIGNVLWLMWQYLFSWF